LKDSRGEPDGARKVPSWPQIRLCSPFPSVLTVRSVGRAICWYSIQSNRFDTIFLLFLLSFLEPGYAQICDKANQAKPPDCPSYNVIAYAFWRFIGVTNDYGAAVTAIATILLAYITYGLVSLGREQSNTARTQLRAYVKLSHAPPGRELARL
jgi:hypothetical protein